MLSNDPNETSIKGKAVKFYYDTVLHILYRKSRVDVLLRCLSQKEAQEVLEEAHNRIYEAH